MVHIEASDLILALVGGVIIGLATTINLTTYGRITGNSGIFNTLIKFDMRSGFRWKYSFFSGLIAASYSLFMIMGKSGGWEIKGFNIILFDKYEENISDLHIVGWIIGGFLVGVGTKMGNGCTSGHGVWGIPRFSIRSLAAVCTFMASGVALATIRNYEPFLNNTNSFGSDFEDAWRIIGGVLALISLLAFLVYLAMYWRTAQTIEDKYEMPVSWSVGFLFGIGLVISGMCRRTKILGFLTLNSDWDPSLMLVMVGAIGVNLFTFHYIINVKQTPTFAPKLCIPTNSQIDFKLICGAAIFGLGWGLSGLCPGPGMVVFFTMTHGLLWIPSLAAGQIAYEITERLIVGS